MSKPLISIRNLSIRLHGGRKLLSEQDIDLHAGEVTLLVGPSGSGKSTLARLLAGLLVPGRYYDVAGTMHCNGQAFTLSKPVQAVAGYVFQNGALFDDLTASGNLQFVLDHGVARGLELPESAKALLPQVDLHRPVSTLSGGEAMRLAITRTLIIEQKAIIYDEPNSGLDPDVSRQLAAFIADYARASGIPAIIIAHHFDEFVPLADKILFLSPEDAKLRGISIAEAAGGLVERYEQVRTSSDRDAPKLPAPSLGRAWAWVGHYFWHYFWLLFASPSALLYLMCGMLLLGVTATWFLFQHFPHKEFLSPLFRDKVLEALGFVMYRAIVPAASCFFVAARGSAMLANDLGHRVYTQQLASMRNLGLPTRRYFWGIPLLVMLVTALLSTGTGLIIASFASWQTWNLLFPMESVVTWQSFYFRRILQLDGLSWVCLKVSLSGIGIGLATCWQGLRPKRTVLDVHNHTAQAIIIAILVTLFVQTVIALTEF